MSADYGINDATQKDDGLNLKNCKYALLLVLSYVIVALVIGTGIAGHF